MKKLRFKMIMKCLKMVLPYSFYPIDCTVWDKKKFTPKKLLIILKIIHEQ